MQQKEHDSSIQYLADRQAIADLLATYCERLDEYDIDGVGKVFTDDGAMDQGPGRGGPIRGPAQIVAGMKKRQALFRRTHHQLGQSKVEIEGDCARALTYVIAWHLTWEEKVLIARLRYRDELVRISGGQWRIARRTSEALGVEGFTEEQWNWVERRRVEK
jgi:SnoaL-like protein